MVVLYNGAGLVSPALSPKGVNKWSSHAEREGAVVAATETTVAGAGVVFDVSAETKVKRY